MTRMHGIIKTVLVGLIAMHVAAAGASPPAYAAETDQTASEEAGMMPAVSPGDTGDVYRLPAVTVTADKRVTEVQKTPISLTVLTEQDLADKNIRTVKDALNMVPNLYTANWVSGANWTSFRGALSIASTQASPLVLYVDGVPVDAFFHLDANLMEVERIEILRGPQSAIYGKNSLGGVINIISKKPTNNYRGKIGAYLESREGWGINASIAGPLKEDVLFFSLAASHDYQHGWMSSHYTSKSNISREERAKGQLRFTPTDRAEFIFHVDYSAIRNGYYPYTLGNSYGNKSWATVDDSSKGDFLNTALKAQFDFDHAAFDSITTYRYEKSSYYMYARDWMNKMQLAPGLYFDGTSMGGDGKKKNEVTQEFRLRSPDDKKGFAWLVGVFGSYADFDLDHLYQYFDYFIFPGYLENTYYNQWFRQYTTELAPFAQVTVPLTDAFKVTAGLRWHYTHRKAHFKLAPHSDIVAAGMMPLMNTSADDSWSELLPKLLLSYDLTDKHMLYAGVSRSFIPGGFNYATQQDYGFTYDSQTAWNYEIGAKTAWLDDRLKANLALFYSDFEDLQVMQFNPLSNNYTAHNAGSATSYGAELDVMARLAKGLDAQVGFGYTHARYNDYTHQGVVYNGNKIELTPEYTINASLTYRHDNGLFLMGSARYVSKLYWQPENVDRRDPVITVDAKIGYEGEHFDAYVYGRNIFGTRYLNYYTPITKLGWVAEPQTFGVEIAYKF